MEINLLFFFTVFPAILLFGIAKSGLGGSIALISIPLMTVAMPLTQALGIILPILIFSDFIATYKYRKEFDLSTLKLMVPFAALGIIIGSLTFSYFSEALLKFIVGLMGFLFAGHYFFFKKNKEEKSPKNSLKGSICSTIAGFTSFCVHAGGTPTSIYMLPLRMKKEIYVGTRIIFFTFVNLIKLPLYINLSMTNLETFKQSLILFPVALLGILVGYQLLKIIEEKLFYNILYSLILITSTKLLYDFLL
ncbi:sulfite exporter TauE/SafE family protein [Candidatus Pelagibacter communis]|uniref:sulfite exporter TauE/SafE family protein n=1 Tax=Pelagibacter ubique TaxID=198252 RepID=UPI00065B38F9|nr:sulfite exporter TauE/SafE family protein [Candidatus Pelagibacter ubique]